jgi:hypothetical protein
MIFKYGNYSHANNEVSLTAMVRLIKSKRGQTQFVKHTWNLQGVLQAETQAALTTALTILEDAYGDDGKDAGLYLDNGTTATNLVLDSSAASGGVRILQKPSFPVGNGAEYSTFRTYTIVLEADFVETSTGLLDFTETIDFIGTGGPRFVYLPVLNGLPQRQLVNQRTVQRVVQFGSALGHGTYPVPPPPKWPFAEKEDLRRIRAVSPLNLNGTLTEFRIDWHYTFESGGITLAGLPTII